MYKQANTCIFYAQLARRKYMQSWEGVGKYVGRGGEESFRIFTQGYTSVSFHKGRAIKQAEVKILKIFFHIFL